MSSLATAPTRATEIDCAGERVWLTPERAAWWPARSTLLVADLHVGKEATFRRHGIAMPDAVLDEAIARLDRAIATTRAGRIVVIGDLIHGRAGLTEDVVERFAAWRERFNGTVELVLGNHDRHVRSLPPSWRVELREESSPDGPFVYRHEPSSRDALASGVVEWAGHLHPTLRIVGAAAPAFVVSEQQVILPAFTSFSRGPGFLPCQGQQVHVIADGAVHRA